MTPKYILLAVAFLLFACALIWTSDSKKYVVQGNAVFTEGTWAFGTGEMSFKNALLEARRMEQLGYDTTICESVSGVVRQQRGSVIIHDSYTTP